MEYFYRPFLYKTWNGFERIEKVEMVQIRKWQNIDWKNKEIKLLLIFFIETILFESLKCRAFQIDVAIIFPLCLEKLSLLSRDYSREETICGNTVLSFAQLSNFLTAPGNPIASSTLMHTVPRDACATGSEVLFT